MQTELLTDATVRQIRDRLEALWPQNALIAARAGVTVRTLRNLRSDRGAYSTDTLRRVEQAMQEIERQAVAS